MRILERLKRYLDGGKTWRGDAHYLLGRSPDPALCDVDGVPTALRDEALELLCESFDIPERQKYCLRPDDEIMAIYGSFVEARFWDDWQLERLHWALRKVAGERLSRDLFSTQVRTVADLLRFVAANRRGEG